MCKKELNLKSLIGFLSLLIIKESLMIVFLINGLASKNDIGIHIPRYFIFLTSGECHCNFLSTCMENTIFLKKSEEKNIVTKNVLLP